MSVPAKLGAFGVVLALCFAGGAAVGAAVGPIDVGGSTAPEHQPEPAHDPAPEPVDHEGGH